MWNEEGALLDFSIAPAFYQTHWFRLAILVSFSWPCSGWLINFVSRQLAHQFNMTLEARVSERTRIARELHDTLLQSFQGLLLQVSVGPQMYFHASQSKPSRGWTAHSIRRLQAITEGRDAVQGLRSSAFETNDLANGIAAIAEELTSDSSAVESPAIDVEVEGAPRNLNPVVRDEAYRIAGEALRNAFRHAQARRITVEIRYDKRQFRLRVRDDGKGIDERHHAQQQPAGHFGLHGMRERAEIVGGRLEVWSKLDSGTRGRAEHSRRDCLWYLLLERSWLSKVLSGKSRKNERTEP